MIRWENCAVERARARSHPEDGPYRRHAAATMPTSPLGNGLQHVFVSDAEYREDDQWPTFPFYRVDLVTDEGEGIRGCQRSVSSSNCQRLLDDAVVSSMQLRI